MQSPIHIKFECKLSDCTCAKPNVANMDHFKHSPGDWNNPQKIVNRVCLRCYTHWYGEASEVRTFTSKAWDAYLEQAL